MDRFFRKDSHLTCLEKVSTAVCSSCFYQFDELV